MSGVSPSDLRELAEATVRARVAIETECNRHPEARRPLNLAYVALHAARVGLAEAADGIERYLSQRG